MSGTVYKDSKNLYVIEEDQNDEKESENVKFPSNFKIREIYNQTVSEIDQSRKNYSKKYSKSMSLFDDFKKSNYSEVQGFVHSSRVANKSEADKLRMEFEKYNKNYQMKCEEYYSKINGYKEQMDKLDKMKKDIYHSKNISKQSKVHLELFVYLLWNVRQTLLLNWTLSYIPTKKSIEQKKIEAEENKEEIKFKNFTNSNESTINSEVNTLKDDEQLEKIIKTSISEQTSMTSEDSPSISSFRHSIHHRFNSDLSTIDMNTENFRDTNECVTKERNDTNSNKALQIIDDDTNENRSEAIYKLMQNHNVLLEKFETVIDEMQQRILKCENDIEVALKRDISDFSTNDVLEDINNLKIVINIMEKKNEHQLKSYLSSVKQRVLNLETKSTQNYLSIEKIQKLVPSNKRMFSLTSILTRIFIPLVAFVMIRLRFDYIIKLKTYSRN
ncbi:hypothetical protein A3Q56_04869, partial [Intoshia linei]